VCSRRCLFCESLPEYLPPPQEMPADYPHLSFPLTSLAQRSSASLPLPAVSPPRRVFLSFPFLGIYSLVRFSCFPQHIETCCAERRLSIPCLGFFPVLEPTSPERFFPYVRLPCTSMRPGQSYPSPPASGIALLFLLPPFFLLTS